MFAHIRNSYKHLVLLDFPHEIVGVGADTRGFDADNLTTCLLATMSQKYPKMPRNLSMKYDLDRLGEGNSEVGTNLLVAMACTIANIYPPGSCFIDKQGNRLAVGASLLVRGALTCALVHEHVLAGLEQQQRNVLTHLAAWDAHHAWIEENTKSNMKKPMHPLDFTDVKDPMYGLFPEGESIKNRHHLEGALGMIVNPPEWGDRRRLHDHPLVYMSGGSWRDILRQIDRGHLDRPLIHIPLISSGQCSAMEEGCLQLLHGIAVEGQPGRISRARLLASDTGEVLADCTALRWLRYLFWLGDAPCRGPVESPDDQPSTKPPPNLTAQYRNAIEWAWIARLDFTGKPFELQMDIKPWQQKWIETLVQLSRDCPGLIESGRSLFASVLFGLHRMAVAGGVGDLSHLANDALTLCMIKLAELHNQHAVLTHSSETAKRLRLRLRIGTLLADAPMGVRDLVRKFHRISTEDCRALLDEMRAHGQAVMLADGRWALASTAGTTPQNPQPLNLEV